MIEKGLLPVTLLMGTGGPARAQDPCDEIGDCLPAVTLRPTAPNYWAEWRSATTRVMSGRRASPLYRDSCNRMSAWWRLVEVDRERPYLSEEDESRARNLAWIGTIEGFENMLRETFERSEQLGVLYRIGSTVSGADLQLSKRGEKTRVRYNADPTGARHGQIELNEDGIMQSRRSDPSVRGGFAFRLVDMAAEEDVVDAQLAWTSYFDLRRLGFDGLRLQLSDTLTESQAAVPSPPDPASTEKGLWSATLRQGIVPALDAFGRISGQEYLDWAPTELASGLSLQLPVENPWFLRGELQRRLPGTDPSGLQPDGEWRVMLSLRSQLRWSLPSSSEGWPLGQQVDLSSPALEP